MSTLPELTDEQIDTAWKRANTTTLTEHGPVLNRGLPSWRELRAAFPKPKPPEPSWEGGKHYDQSTITVSIGGDGSWVLLSMPLADELDAKTGLNSGEARDMAAVLVDCADWIEANR